MPSESAPGPGQRRTRTLAPLWRRVLAVVQPRAALGAQQVPQLGGRRTRAAGARALRARHFAPRGRRVPRRAARCARRRGRSRGRERAPRGRGAGARAGRRLRCVRRFEAGICFGAERAPARPAPRRAAARGCGRGRCGGAPAVGPGWPARRAARPRLGPRDRARRAGQRLHRRVDDRRGRLGQQAGQDGIGHRRGGRRAGFRASARLGRRRRQERCRAGRRAFNFCRRPDRTLACVGAAGGSCSSARGGVLSRRRCRPSVGHRSGAGARARDAQRPQARLQRRQGARARIGGPPRHAWRILRTAR